MAARGRNRAAAAGGSGESGRIRQVLCRRSRLYVDWCRGTWRRANAVTVPTPGNPRARAAVARPQGARSRGRARCSRVGLSIAARPAAGTAVGALPVGC